MKKIAISGYYGRENFGDELILRSIMRSIVADDIGDVIVAAENPEQVAQSHGVGAFSRHNLDRANIEAAASTALVLGGGGLWHDYSFDAQGGKLGLFSDSPWSITGYAKLPLLWRMHNRPVHVFGIGVGPLRSQAARNFLRFMSEQVETISVRDDKSRELLYSIDGWEKDVNVFPDPVFALDLPPFPARHNDGETVIGVNLRSWPYEESTPFIERLASVLAAAAKTQKITIHGIPLQSDSDVPALESLFRLLPSSIKRKIVDTYSYDSTIRHIQGCSAVLSMRLHAAILGWRLGIPTMGFAYDPKVSTLFEQLRVPELALPLHADESALADGLHTLISADRYLLDAVGNTVCNLEKETSNGLKFLNAQLDKA